MHSATASPRAAVPAWIRRLVATPCNGYTAVRKVWEPQFSAYTGNKSETTRFVGGLKGRFGGDWNWDTYVQYGETSSSSYQTNVPPTCGWRGHGCGHRRPRDPAQWRAKSDLQPAGMPRHPRWRTCSRHDQPATEPGGESPALGAGCQPLNVFGSTFSDPADQLRQQQAIDYAFVDTSSSGKNSLTTLSLSTNGTLWQGWAGPLAGAFGIEVREDKVSNAGTTGDFYLRADLARNWADAFGGKTRVTEGFTEFDMPLVTGLDGANLLLRQSSAPATPPTTTRAEPAPPASRRPRMSSTGKCRPCSSPSTTCASA